MGCGFINFKEIKMDKRPSWHLYFIEMAFWFHNVLLVCVEKLVR